MTILGRLLVGKLAGIWRGAAAGGQGRGRCDGKKHHGKSAPPPLVSLVWQQFALYHS